VFLAGGSFAGAAYAEPYFAVREGFRCNQCHVNPTGGGKRNPFGSIYERTGLSARVWDWSKVTGVDSSENPLEVGTYFDSALADRISVGGDFRARLGTTFDEPTGDLWSFDVTDGRAYLQADLHPERLTLYFDESLAPGGAQSREAWALVRDLPGGAYAKAGKILPAFGWRLQDNAAYVRQASGVNYSTPDLGVELGAIHGPGMVSVSVTNGNGGASEVDRRKQVAVWSHMAWKKAQVGASFLYNEGGGERRLAYGAHGGLDVGRFTFLAEAALVEDLPEPGSPVRQLATLFETDFQLAKGWNLKSTLEYLDPDREISENAKIRVGFGLETFLAEGIQTSLMWRAQDSIPQDPQGEVDSLFAELHVFF
jgi:hypothetical protein